MPSTYDPPHTSLAATTAAARSEMREQFGPMFDEFDVLADRQAINPDIAAAAPDIGDKAPTFRLPDARGGDLDLADVLTDGPAVIVFYRGAWCPYCNIQLNAFQRALDDIEATGATLIAISPQTPDTSLSLAEKAELAFPVLSDIGNTVASQYGLTYRLDADSIELYSRAGVDVPGHNGDASWELPTSAVFVIRTDGAVLYRSVTAEYRWRVGPAEILAALRELA